MDGLLVYESCKISVSDMSLATNIMKLCKRSVTITSLLSRKSLDGEHYMESCRDEGFW
jgi:hypothetical protein